MLSKTDYIHYLDCPIHLWLHKHRSHETKPHSAQTAWMIEQGGHVEAWARSLFPDGELVAGHSEQSALQTQELIEAGMTTLFQATVAPDGLFAMADIFQLDPVTQEWNIYEVKSTTDIEDHHLQDVCFQMIAFQKAGFTIGKLHLIHVNGNYIRNGDIEAQALLSVRDITEDVRALEGEVSSKIALAKQVASSEEMPSCEGCTCAPKECPCLHYCYPDLPEYSVFDLNNIRIKKARQLYRSGLRNLLDLSDGDKWTAAQLCQLKAARSGKPIIEAEAIHGLLSQLTYPLCFFDYEAFNPAIPLFDGFKPYQQMPFQYSLHVLSADGELQHHEYLARDLENPLPGLLQTLASHMPTNGSVVVWYKSFEMNRNKEMATMMLEYAPLLRGMNARVFDLMEIFKKQHYVHPAFKGSCSIKSILPVLVPSLSYKDLAIQEGGTASVAWYRMLTKKCPPKEKEETCNHMLAYCKLDTLAMVEVFRELSRIAA